ncbi:MAG: 3'-5' exonuclease, partial [Chloroflexi bacterium]|nr:3'-5' exonuclease [Chloroflexota bacterium]
MMDETCVSLDLETTGLDPENDRILEIGAVKFRGRDVLDIYHTLVNPDRPLPNRVRLLTGISGEELRSAPSLSQVAVSLLSFVADLSIVGQSVKFDISFLSAEGFSLGNKTLDVFELASILLPQLLDYSLPALADQMGIPCPVHHRALDDAMTAREVFIALLDRAAGLELPLIAEINRLTMGADWPWRSMFVDIERAKVKNVSLWD